MYFIVLSTTVALVSSIGPTKARNTMELTLVPSQYKIRILVPIGNSKHTSKLQPKTRYGTAFKTMEMSLLRHPCVATKTPLKLK